MLDNVILDSEVRESNYKDMHHQSIKGGVPKSLVRNNHGQEYRKLPSGFQPIGS